MNKRYCQNMREDIYSIGVLIIQYLWNQLRNLFITSIHMLNNTVLVVTCFPFSWYQFTSQIILFFIAILFCFMYSILMVLFSLEF